MSGWGWQRETGALAGIFVARLLDGDEDATEQPTRHVDGGAE